MKKILISLIVIILSITLLGGVMDEFDLVDNDYGYGGTHINMPFLGSRVVSWEKISCSIYQGGYDKLHDNSEIIRKIIKLLPLPFLILLCGVIWSKTKKEEVIQ